MQYAHEGIHRSELIDFLAASSVVILRHGLDGYCDSASRDQRRLDRRSRRCEQLRNQSTRAIRSRAYRDSHADHRRYCGQSSPCGASYRECRTGQEVSDRSWPIRRLLFSAVGFWAHIRVVHIIEASYSQRWQAHTPGTTTTG